MNIREFPLTLTVVIALAFLVAPAVAQGKAPTTQPAKPVQAKPKLDPAKVEQLIAQLDHEDFRRREQATQQLRAMGTPATKLLRKAAEDKNLAPEMKHRLELVLVGIRTDELLAAAASADTKGKATAGRFRRHEDKNVYVGAHSMQATYRYSELYRIVAELAVLHGVVDPKIAPAVRKNKGMNWTLPVPFDVWKEGQDKPSAKWLDKRLQEVASTARTHEMRRCMQYVEQLRIAGIEVPVPKDWKRAATQPASNRVKGWS